MMYTVKLTRPRTKSLDEGHEWSQTLPNEWFVKKYHFDGHDYGPFGPKIKSPTKPIREYTLFWFPKSLKSGMELLTLIHKKKTHSSMKGCFFSLNCRQHQGK